MGRANTNRKKQSRGLKQVRFYCQICEKQCSDANGYKCHLASPSHKRQMELVQLKPEQYAERFSNQFLQGFLEVLEENFGTKPVDANKVYNLFVSDPGHVHMNATQWSGLGQFVRWLGKHGYATLTKTDAFYDITYIPSGDPEEEDDTSGPMSRNHQEQELAKDASRQDRLLAKQIKTGWKRQTSSKVAGNDRDAKVSSLERARASDPSAAEQKIAITLGSSDATTSRSADDKKGQKRRAVALGDNVDATDVNPHKKKPVSLG
eukprot:Clim_evm27s215 gene=Clim_evmTU27s215